MRYRCPLPFFLLALVSSYYYNVVQLLLSSVPPTGCHAFAFVLRLPNNNNNKSSLRLQQRHRTITSTTSTTNIWQRQQLSRPASSAMSSSDHDNDNMMMISSSSRIELFFSSPEQLRQRVQLLQSYGYTKFNLVNKNAQDNLLEWCTIIYEANADADICCHFSLKYNKVPRKGNDAHGELLKEFVDELVAVATSDNGKTMEILLVSGGHNANKPGPKWNTVDALQGYAAAANADADASAKSTTTKFAVAYNPYIPDLQRQQEETKRLNQKLETQLVSKIYLQFGTDLIRLKQALEYLQDDDDDDSPQLQLAGSVFLPTKQLIAQQKFRPWNGVHLSQDFLAGPENAKAIVVQILKLYRQYNVEPLWEAPGIRTHKDLELVTELLVLAASSSSSSPTPTTTSATVATTSTEGDQEPTIISEGQDDATTEAKHKPATKTTYAAASTSASITSPPSSFAAAAAAADRGASKTASSSSPATKRQKTLLEHDGFTSKGTKKQQAPSKLDPSSTCLLLFGSHDLRLYDNLALVEACQNHATVIPVFLWSPLLVSSGGIQAEALEVLVKEAVYSLRRELDSFGLQLICRHCGGTGGGGSQEENMKREFANLLAETNASAVYYNRDFTPHGRQLELARATVCKQIFPQVILKGCQSTLLYDIDLVSLTKGFHGGHWGTLMPFLKNCQRHYGKPRRPIPKHETFALLQNLQPPTLTGWPASSSSSPPTAEGSSKDPLSFLAVLPPKVKPWHKGIKDAFPNDVSHKGAHEILDAFFESNNSGYRRYEKERSRADKELATSRLSYHLRLGTLSPNELYWRHEDHPVDSNIFSRRLIWRDLAYYQLRCFPQMSQIPIRAHYQDTSWVSGAEAERRFEAWKWGRTGYPIVDAGMRELYQTGWMTQTVRMVVASFLVEYLRVNWVKGCEWFHYTLVDADSAINAMMWQNAGKCGIDQWNFVLSPESASQDPTGKYTKKWVPELAKLPIEMLHRPWQNSPSQLQQYGVVLGQNYPHRVATNLKEERARSIESTLNMRRNSQEYNDSKGYDTIRLPNGEKTVVFTKKEYRIDRSGNLKPEYARSAASSSI